MRLCSQTEALFGYTIKVKIAYDYTTTVVFINSCLNPFVYCWRIKEIRHAVKNTLRRITVKIISRRSAVKDVDNFLK